MVVKFDKPSGAHGNTSSCSDFVNYMRKEDDKHHEFWYNSKNSELSSSEVRKSIDKDHQGIGKNEGKFATGSISITEDEWKALGKNDEEREINFKSWTKDNFEVLFSSNFNKKDSKGHSLVLDPKNVNICFKLEHNRYYKGTDQEVLHGMKKQGQAKEGFNKHVHFIVARKTLDGKNRISPTTNNKKEFCRDELTKKAENDFDKTTGYNRPLEQSYNFAKTMKNGSIDQKEEMILTKIAEERKLQENQIKIPELRINKTVIKEQQINKDYEQHL